METAAARLDALRPWFPPARAAVPILATSLSSKYPGAAEAATYALRRIAPEVLTNAPAQ